MQVIIQGKIQEQNRLHDRLRNYDYEKMTDFSSPERLIITVILQFVVVGGFFLGIYLIAKRITKKRWENKRKRKL